MRLGLGHEILETVLSGMNFILKTVVKTPTGFKKVCDLFRFVF